MERRVEHMCLTGLGYTKQFFNNTKVVLYVKDDLKTQRDHIRKLKRKNNYILHVQIYEHKYKLNISYLKRLK